MINSHIRSPRSSTQRGRRQGRPGIRVAWKLSNRVLSDSIESENMVVRGKLVSVALCLMGLMAAMADAQSVRSDWLIDSTSFVAKFEQPDPAQPRYELDNGLVKRTFLVEAPVAATIGLESVSSGQAILRAVKPEAVVVIDGVRYEVGGLSGQPNHAFLRDAWIDQMKPAPGSLEFVTFSIGPIEERFAWKRTRHHEAGASWPPPGIRVSFEYQPPEQKERPTPDFRVFVHYELYDGLPLISKWLTVENRSEANLVVNRFTSELLAIVEHESHVEFREGVDYPRPTSIHVETDFAFGGFGHANANRHVVHWRTDPDYRTQVNYELKTPCLLMVEPTRGPQQTVLPQQTFSSCRAFELVFDGTDRERRSLSLRKMYRCLAPWVTENPLMHHMRVADPEAVRKAIDDAAAVGFETVILSFGSGFDIENRSPEYVARWQDVAAYAAEKGIEIGGYSLLSSRKIGGGNDIVSPPGQKPTHGNCPALTSPWGQAYYQRLYEFFEQSGFTLLEHDGPYPGDVDVTQRLPLQQGIQDSRWVQGKIANDFYRWCREQGIFVNAPDFYFLNGTNKCGMGYREVNWSLPRDMQVLHTRQNIYDGTWSKTPSMGWMFVPLSEYHGGGELATIEPLHEHLDHYGQMLDSNLGLGVQACYRGPRLFDTAETRELVKSKVDWFRKYRQILESDVVHGRRPDGRDLDWMLHVNPNLKRKGMLVVYNPTSTEISKSIRLGLYYTGLTAGATIREQDQNPVRVSLDRSYSVELPVKVPAGGMNWYVIETDSIESR